MDPKSRIESAGRWLAAGVGLAAASYAAYVATTWYRYGQVKRAGGSEEDDELLDRFMPAYEVVERHHVRVDAPAGGGACRRARHGSASLAACARNYQRTRADPRGQA